MELEQNIHSSKFVLCQTTMFNYIIVIVDSFVHLTSSWDGELIVEPVNIQLILLEVNFNHLWILR